MKPICFVVFASTFLVLPLMGQGPPPACVNGTESIENFSFSANTLYQLTGSSGELASQMQFISNPNRAYFALGANATVNNDKRIGIDTRNSPAIIWNSNFVASDGAACLYLGNNSSSFQVGSILGANGAGAVVSTCQSQAAGIVTLQTVSGPGYGDGTPVGNGIKVNIQAVTDEADICEFIADDNCNMFGITPPSSCVAYFTSTCGDQAHCGGDRECCVFEWQTTLAEKLGITASSFSWDFGDGNKSTSRSPVHTYLHPTQHQVSLTIKDSKGKTYTITETMFTEP